MKTAFPETRRFKEVLERKQAELTHVLRNRDGIAIEKSNRDLPPQVVDQLFKLQAGQTSSIVESPLGLEILKVSEQNISNVRAAHIYFAFKGIDAYLKPLKDQQKSRTFISP